MVAFDDGRGGWTADEITVADEARIVLYEDDRDTPEILDGMLLTRSEYSPRPSFSRSTNFNACTSPSSSGTLTLLTSAANVKPSGTLMSRTNSGKSAACFNVGPY